MNLIKKHLKKLYDTACTVGHYTFAKPYIEKTLSLDCRFGLD